MPPRLSGPARDRDYDYSNVGKVGRRTGVTLAPRPLDEHGLEEITGLFSSPRKPSPINGKKTIIESIENSNDATTPQANPRSQSEFPALSSCACREILTAPTARTPRSVESLKRPIRGHSYPPPRSASPKKSGITGTARRSGAVDVLANNQLQQELWEDIRDNGNITQLSATPPQHANTRAVSARPATIGKRISPDRTPLRNRVLNQRAAKSAVVGRVSDAQSLTQEAPPDDLPEETPSRVHLEPVQHDETEQDMEQQTEESVVANTMADDDGLEEASAARVVDQHLSPEPELELENELEIPDPPLIENDNSDVDQTFEPPFRSKGHRAVPNKANSRRKRKSDALEEAESIAATTSSPAAKRATHRGNYVPNDASPQPATKKRKGPRNESQIRDKPASSQSAHGRKPLSKKDTNMKLSSQTQQELDSIVEKIRARPSAPRSLYVLRRETPMDDSVSHTRSGRISIKPLAYWRNERCVYSGTPNRISAGIEDGARFPLNSIKEIVRSEEVPESSRARNRKSKKSKNSGRGKGKGKSRVRDDEEDDTDIDLDPDNENADPDADEWELNSGTLKGPIASWDVDHQTGVPEDLVDADIAHAHGAIQTKDVKACTFRYAKLLNTRFFGAGVVDLPGGGLKSAKNSRKMHMCFFVVQGRVTVQVGAQDGTDEEWGTRFSIGKGGFWQVPRGKEIPEPMPHDNGR